MVKLFAWMQVRRCPGVLLRFGVMLRFGVKLRFVLTAQSQPQRACAAVYPLEASG